MKKSIYPLLILVLFFAGCILVATVYRNITSVTSLSTDPSIQSSFKLDINTASVEELTYIPGIGEATAAQIVAHRKQHGHFKNLEDLLQVKGIGQKTYDKISDYLTVGD